MFDRKVTQYDPVSSADVLVATEPKQDDIITAIGAIGGSPVTTKPIKVAYTASQTAATVLIPTAGKKIVITDFVISAVGAGTVYLFDNADSSTTGIGPIFNFAAQGGATINFGKAFTSAAVNNVIKYTSGAGASGSIWIHYYEV